MNLYFLVEGQTEARVYPQWLHRLAPFYTQVRHARQARRNNFFVFNARGYPSIIKKHLPLAIDEVNDLGNFHYLILCFDADEESIARREHFLFDFLDQENKRLSRARLVVVVQNCCIETWFLGNRKLFTPRPRDPLLALYRDFYDVHERDPERMGRFYGATTRQYFHQDYFKLLAREHGLHYRKGNPSMVEHAEYLRELLARHRETGQMESFGHFLAFCESLS